MLGYGLNDRRFESRQRLGIFLVITMSRSALGPTQPPVQWVQEGLSLEVKRLRCEADHSHPSTWYRGQECVQLYLHTNTPSWRGAQSKHRDNFALLLYYYYHHYLYHQHLILQFPFPVYFSS
jgi:hypothetical protein